MSTENEILTLSDTNIPTRWTISRHKVISSLVITIKTRSHGRDINNYIVLQLYKYNSRLQEAVASL